MFHGQIWNILIGRHVGYSGDGVDATLEDLTGKYIVDGDVVDDSRLSLGDNSLITYLFFFPPVPFPLESCDRCRGGLAPPDDISMYRKIILQINNEIEYWDKLKFDN